MVEPPVLVILFGAADGETALLAVRRRHPGAKLILLTTARAVPRLAPLADEVWAEGIPRGAVRFLALMRRMAWAGPAHIYDLEDSPPTRFMRLCVWPRPQWHGRDALAGEPVRSGPLS